MKNKLHVLPFITMKSLLFSSLMLLLLALANNKSGSGMIKTLHLLLPTCTVTPIDSNVVCMPIAGQWKPKQHQQHHSGVWLRSRQPMLNCKKRWTGHARLKGVQTAVPFNLMGFVSSPIRSRIMLPLLSTTTGRNSKPQVALAISKALQF